jgi:quinol monooxygenase YgiN
MRVCRKQAPSVALFSLLLTAAAYGDDGERNRPTVGAPIFNITHVDVIPATVNGVDFQQTAYAALFKYRNASLHDQGLESFRVVNWVLAANHAQIVVVWDNIEALNRHLARTHSVDFRYAVQIQPPPPPPDFNCCIGSPLDDRQYSLVKSFGTPWVSNSLPSTVGSSGALFVITYVDFLHEVLEADPGAGQTRLVQYGAASSQANSGHLLSYSVLQQLDRPNRYVFLEVWDTELNYLAWQYGAVTKSFIAKTTPLLGSPLDHRLNILCGETFVDGTGCVAP